MKDIFEVKKSEVDKLIRDFLEAEWNRAGNQKEMLEIVAVRPEIVFDIPTGKPKLAGFSVDVNIVNK